MNFFLIAEQNNVIRTNYIKAKNDQMQEISNCRLDSKRDETDYLIIISRRDHPI